MLNCNIMSKVKEKLILMDNSQETVGLVVGLILCLIVLTLISVYLCRKAMKNNANMDDGSMDSMDIDSPIHVPETYCCDDGITFCDEHICYFCSVRTFFSSTNKCSLF